MEGDSTSNQSEEQVGATPLEANGTPVAYPSQGAMVEPRERSKNDKTAWLDVSLYVFILLVFVFIGFLVGSTLLKIEIPFLTPMEKTIELPALPESTGIYLYDGTDYAQMQNHLGVPEYEEGIPTTENRQPWVLIKQSGTPHSELVFQYEDGAIVSFSDNLVNEDASLVIPNGVLPAGLYCLIEADNNETDLRNYWCFRIN